MLVETSILPQCLAGTGGLGNLLALYEANYIKLTRLVADLPQCVDRQLSVSHSDFDLYLSIEQRTKYTCEVRLTYRFDAEVQSAPRVADPDMIVKVFFDARMAEVHSWIEQSRHQMLRPGPGHHGREIERRWERNMVLSKWLDYLLENRHFFNKSNPLALST